MPLKKALSEIPQKGSVSQDYFFRMMSPTATKYANPFLDEEKRFINETLDGQEKLRSYNFVTIGSGQLSLLEIALRKAKSYTAIEPLLNLWLSKDLLFMLKGIKKVKLINKQFGKFDKKKLFPGHNLFIFLFNILAYIEHPLSKINSVITPGDVLFITTWQRSTKAEEIRTEYFNYLNSFENETIIDPKKTIGLCKLKYFPFHKLKYYKKHKYLNGDIVSGLIIYT